MDKEALMRVAKPMKKRILVVEDQDDERNLPRLALREYDVAAAGDYDTGLRMARRQYFDLYVLDNQIPGGTGIELCRRIREFDPNTPILFCSGSADSSEALGAGAQAYFAKQKEGFSRRRSYARRFCKAVASHILRRGSQLGMRKT